METRIHWAKPSIDISSGTLPEWGLVLENPLTQTIRWDGGPIVAYGALRRLSGNEVVRGAFASTYPAVAMHHVMKPGELRPVYFTVHLVDDELKDLIPGRYEATIASCKFPEPSQYPPPLLLTVSQPTGS
jgi:hypothetical protein